MSRRQKELSGMDSTILSVASTSLEGQENRTLKVTLLSSEWKSSTHGDFPTINRELAIQLAKHSNVDVSVLLPKCSEEDRSSAESHNVKLVEADRVPGLESVLCLSSPPRNHIMDCVIGHGIHLGQQIALIKRNPNYCHCKWIQVVHSAPEEDGMYKNISEGQKKQETEIQLCQMADQVITIGPKLAEAYKRHLRPSKQEENVFDLTPSIFSEFLEKEQATEERQTFCVLVIGSGDSHEDFSVKGYDIAAKAIAELKDESYQLRFVCAPGGKGDEIAEKLLDHDIGRNQLIVRSFNDSREVLANLFCEVDLAIMPSRTEGFGITALKALSAGLPILVSGNSGLGKALKKVPVGSSSVVDSEDPKVWARAVKLVRQKEREVRLLESSILREKYLEKYSWEEPCKRLVNRMYKLTFGTSESGTIFPIRDKRPTPILVADQPSKRLREELIQSAHYELQGAEGPFVGHLPQSSMECEQFSLPRVTVSQNKPIDPRSFTQSQNRYPSSEHCQNPVAGASSTYHGGVVHQGSHPQGSSGYGSPTPEVASHIQGSLSAAILNQNNYWNPTFPQTGQNIHLSSEHGQNPYAGASSTHYEGLVHQGYHSQGRNRHSSSQHGQNSYAGASSTHYRRLNIEGYPQEVNSSQGNLPTTFTNFSSQGSQTFPQSQNRHPYTGHGHPFPGACSTSNFGLGHQEYQPHGSPSYGLPAPVAVNYHQGNFAAPLVNINYQRSQTFPQMEHSQSLSASAVHRNEDPTHWGSQTQSLMRQGQWPSLVNQSLPLPQVPTWTPQDPSYHSNHTQGSFGFGLPSSSVSPAASSIQPDPVNKRGTLSSTWPSSSVSNSQLLSQAATPLPTELRCERHGDTSTCLADVCSLLKQEYKKRSQLKPLFWDNTIQLPLEDVYTRLKILSRRKRDFQLENNEVSVSEIFKNGDDTIVLVEGSPGMGKTTFCLKIAHDWANKAISEVAPYPQFEVVLLLKCRDIHGDIIEAIDEQLLPKCNAQAIKRELIDYVEHFHFQKRVLIILDGLDELPKSSESDVNRLLQKQIFPFCYVLATSRQERGIVVRKKVDFDLLLQIEGFTREDAFDYVRKHFKNAGPEQVSRGERLIAEIEENTFLDALWNNPLNLLLLCIVFEDFQGELPSYRTELYQIIVCCILRRYCAKHELEAPVGDEALVRHFEDSLLVLGELAWRCLEEDRFSFREEELAKFESANTNLAARELGLVFKEASLRKINPQHEYCFFHKTFQEYLAAFHLAYGLLKQKGLPNLHQPFYRISVVYRQVFIFVCGILGEDAVLLFEQIGQKLEEWKWDWHDCPEEWATFFKECVSESRNDEQVAMTLCSFVPFPQTMTIDLSNVETRIYFFIFLEAVQSFSQLQLPVHLAIQCWTCYDSNVTGNTLAYFPASYTRLQTLSFSGFAIEGEIATLLCKALTMDSTVHSFALSTLYCISSRIAVAIGASLAGNKTLTTVILKLPGNILKSWVAILDKGLSADTPLTSVALEIFGPLRETAAEGLKNILLNRSLTFLSLTLFGDMEDSVTTSISEGLVANPSLKSLALMFCGKLGHTGLALLTDGFRGNGSLESLELKVFGELPTSWANISRTLHSAVKSTTSFTVYPNVTGIVGTSQVACHSPVLDKNLLASKLHSLAVNIWGELDCSGANDLCKRLIASPVSSVTLNFKGRVTDSVANCLFKHLNQLNTLCQLSISIQGELMGEGKNTLERLSRNQTYSFALNVPDANAGDKICREVGLSADESMSLKPVFTKVKDGCVTKLSVCINNPTRISGDWGCALCEGLAKSESLTTLSLIFSNITSIENIDALWVAMAENMSLTTLSLTLDNYNYTKKDMTLGLRNGLAKTNSLTTLSLTLKNYNDSDIDIISDLNEGLAKNTSLTTLSLTLDNDVDLDEKIFDLNEGLARNTSLTTLSLTFNIYSDGDGDMMSNLNGLAENTSLTALSLTLNNYSECGPWREVTCDLNDGLAENKSLTTLSLTINNYNISDVNVLDLEEGLAKNTSLTALSLTFNNYSDWDGDMMSNLNGLAKNTSLTALSLTVNNYGEWLREVTCDLNNDLAENTSLTTLSLTFNNFGVWGQMVTFDLNDGLAKNTSLTALSLALNNYSDWNRGMMYDLKDGLAKNTSLTTLSLIVNNCSHLNRDLTNVVSNGLANNKSLNTHSLALNNYSYMPLNSFFIGLWNALAKNKTLITLNLTLSNCNNLDEDWIHKLADVLARNTSLSTISLELDIFSEGI